MNTGVFALDRFTWFGMAVVILDVLALMSIWRSRHHGPRAKVVWTVIVAFLPLLGAVAWFLLGRERRRAR